MTAPIPIERRAGQEDALPPPDQPVGKGPMRRFAAILLLSACSQQPAEPGDEADAAAPSAAAASAGNLSGDAAGLQARVDRAMAAVLQDPAGARYREVRSGLAGTVCGEVDPSRTGGGHAGFRPFLVTPEGVARAAISPRLSFDDPTDPFPDLYIRWCASAEELRRLEPELRRAIARSGGASPPAGTLPGDDPLTDSFPAEPGGQPPPSPPSPPAKAESPPDLDSFINSVKRKPDQPPPGG
jgi:hypothetical protein